MKRVDALAFRSRSYSRLNEAAIGEAMAAYEREHHTPAMPKSVIRSGGLNLVPRILAGLKDGPICCGPLAAKIAANEYATRDTLREMHKAGMLTKERGPNNYWKWSLPDA